MVFLSMQATFFVKMNAVDDSRLPCDIILELFVELFVEFMIHQFQFQSRSSMLNAVSNAVSNAMNTFIPIKTMRSGRCRGYAVYG